jgi:hypothetical protein
MTLAAELERQRDHALDRESKDDQLLDDGLLEQENREEATSDELADEFTWEALESDANFDRVLFDGHEFGFAAPVGTDEEMDFIGLPGILEPEQVRELQVSRRIDDCTFNDGWDVYAAFDFSHGDDFDAVTFLAYNINTHEYFADCDAWVNRVSFEKSPYHDLYVKWEKDGWLHVSGDTVVEPEAPIKRVMELDQKDISFIAFGYDAKQSKEPILLLKEWLLNEVGVTKPDAMVVPVSQVFSNYNASVQKIDYCFGGVVKLTLSPSPLWPFEFGNCMLEEDQRMGNKKPLKRTANAKVDNVQCLCSCFNLEESFSNPT